MKVLISGAHFTPAQAVIEELGRSKGVSVVYIGRKHTMEGDSTVSVESQIIPKMGVKFYSIIAGRLRRHTPDLNSIISILKIPVGFIQSFFIVLKEDPDVILSFGGYVAVPVVVSGWLLSKKIITHEQTLVSGLANQICGAMADKIAVSFEKDYDFDKSKIILTGNPIRQELLQPIGLSSDLEKFVRSAKKEKLPLVLITAGNQGSLTLNKNILECMDDLTMKAYVIHQTGDSKFNDFDKLVRHSQEITHPERYKPLKWISSSFIGGLFKKSDLVVSRSGANTMIELSYFGVPTLAIPLPHLYKNEQMVNAKFFESLGLCQILPQSELNSTTLLNKVLQMLSSLTQLRNKALLAKKIVKMDAAKRLAQEVLVLAG